MKKVLLSLLLTLVMIVGMLSAFALIVGAEDVSAEASWGADASNLTGTGTLAEAITAVNDGSANYIRLLTDINVSYSKPADWPENMPLPGVYTVTNGPLTFDFNGKTIAMTCEDSTVYAPVLTVDTGDENTTEKKVVFTDGTDTPGGITNGSGQALLAESPITIQGGVYDGLSTGIEFHAAGGGSCVVTGGVISATHYAVFVNAYCSLDISGGTFLHGANGAILLSGDAFPLTMSGSPVFIDKTPDEMEASADLCIMGKSTSGKTPSVYLDNYSGSGFTVMYRFDQPDRLPDGWYLSQAYGASVSDPADVVLDTVYTLKPIEAKWGTDADNLTHAGSFADAIHAAKEENAGSVYIQLQKNITVPDYEKIIVNVSPGTTLTLDFNGHTVSGRLERLNSTLVDFNISGDAGNGGEKLILLDSSGNTGGISVSEGSPFVSAIPLVVEGGVYKGSGCCYAESTSSVVIEGGLFRSTDSDALYVRNVDTLTISGGTFRTEDAYAFSCSNVGEVNINGGDFSHGISGAMQIEEVTAFKLYGDAVINDAAPEDGSADIVLESETEEMTVDLSAWTGGTLDVKIGEYSVKPFTLSIFTLPDGWDVCKADGTVLTSPAELAVGSVYTIRLNESAAEARWGADEQHLTGYGLLDDAVKAVETGSVRYVRLIKDVTLPFDKSIRFDLPEMETEGDPLIFDFNGHTITGCLSNADFALFDVGYSFAQGAILRDSSDNPGGITAEVGRPLYSSNISVVEGGVYTGSKPASLQNRLMFSEDELIPAEIKGGTFRTTGEYSFGARGEVIISGGTFCHGTKGAIALESNPMNLEPVLKLVGKIDFVDENSDDVSADLCIKGLYLEIKAELDLSEWVGGTFDVMVPTIPGWPEEYQNVFDTENITLPNEKWGIFDSDGSAVTGTLAHGKLYTVKPTGHNVIFYDNSRTGWRYVQAAFEFNGISGYEQGTQIGESSLYFFEIPEGVTDIYFTNFMPGMPEEYFPEGQQRTDSFAVELNKTYGPGSEGGEGDAGSSASSGESAVLKMIMDMMQMRFQPKVIASEGGTVTPDRSFVGFNQNITYTITPDEGYAVADVIVNGKSVGAVSEYTFRNVLRKPEIEVVFEKTGWDNPFTDVSDTDRFYEDIQYVCENGLMNGVGDDRFSPEGTLSRAMLVTILWRLEGEPVVNYLMQFEDVPQDEWYSEAVRWAAAEGIVLGYGDGTFGTEDLITREQLAVILYRYEQYLGGGFSGLWMFPLRYTDAAQVSEWAYEAVCWMTMKDIYAETEDGLLDPAEKATRAETAAFLHGYCEYRTAE